MEHRDNKISLEHGGERPNSGRPKSTGKFGEDTTVMRVPATQKPVIEKYLQAYKNFKAKADYINTNFKGITTKGHAISLPLTLTKVSAGFPSPADNEVEGKLKIDEYLVEDEDASFLDQVEGDSMNREGIVHGTIVVVYYLKEARSGDIVVARLNGDKTIKKLLITDDGKHHLVPSSYAEYPTITITEYDEYYVLGVVDSWFHHRHKA